MLPHLFLLLTIIIVDMAVLCASLLFVQSQVKPFRAQWQNLLDEALVLNLLLLFSGYFFFGNQTDGIEVYSGVLVVFAYLLFGVVFVYHVLNRFPTCKQFLSKLPTKLRNLSLNRSCIEVSDVEEIITTLRSIAHSDMYNIISNEQEDSFEDSEPLLG